MWGTEITPTLDLRINTWHSIKTFTSNNSWVMKTTDNVINLAMCTAQKMKFSIEDFFSKCHQIRRKLRIWSHLLKKSLIENFIFWAVVVASAPLQNIKWFLMTLAKLKEKSLFNFNRQWKLLVEVSALIVSKMCHSQSCWKCY